MYTLNAYIVTSKFCKKKRNKLKISLALNIRLELVSYADEFVLIALCYEVRKIYAFGRNLT